VARIGRIRLCGWRMIYYKTEEEKRGKEGWKRKDATVRMKECRLGMTVSRQKSKESATKATSDLHPSPNSVERGKARIRGDNRNSISKIEHENRALLQGARQQRRTKEKKRP